MPKTAQESTKISSIDRLPVLFNLLTNVIIIKFSQVGLYYNPLNEYLSAQSPAILHYLSGRAKTVIT
jgi:hypothetical protein